MQTPRGRDSNRGSTVALGICTSPPGPRLAAELVEAGCSYYEPTVARSIMGDDRQTFEAGLEGWSTEGLPPRCANVLLPATLRVVGEAVDSEALRVYITETMERVDLLGIERVVFGSGDARRVPEGFSRDEARRQLADALRMAAEAAPPRSRVCLEHLRRAAPKIVNSLDEAGELVEELDLDRLGLVVDAYHLQEEDEDPSVIRRYGSRISHVHVCGPGREPPGPSDEDRLGRVFSELASIDYEGRCSIECNWGDLSRQAPAALASLQRAMQLGGLA